MNSGEDGEGGWKYRDISGSVIDKYIDKDIVKQTERLTVKDTNRQAETEKDRYKGRAAFILSLQETRTSQGKSANSDVYGGR